MLFLLTFLLVGHVTFATAGPISATSATWSKSSADQVKQQQHSGVLVSGQSVAVNNAVWGSSTTVIARWWGDLLGKPIGWQDDGLEGTKAATDAATSQMKAKQICIMTGDVYGTPDMGGTATAFWHLSNLLRDRLQPQADVIWVALETPIQAANCTELRPQYTSHNFDIVCVDGSNSWSTNPFREVGWNALLWLRGQKQGKCDVIHSHEWGGVLRPIVQAKLLGEFPSLHINVVPHGGHMWSRDTADWTAANIIDKEVDADERFVLENADSVVSPSTYMVDHLRRVRGWQLRPETTRIIGNVQSSNALNPKLDDQYAPTGQPEVLFKPFTNVVFFGRLEARKGLNIFLSAVSSLPQRNNPNFKVSFIGSDPTKERGALLRGIQNSWSCHVDIFIGLARHEALTKLQELSNNDGILVVMPSLIDNQPFAVAEVALAGFPMLAFDVGGIGEMLTPLSREETLVPVDPAALRTKLERLVDEGEAPVPVLDPRVLLASPMWLDWHRNLTAPGFVVQSPPSSTTGAIRTVLQKGTQFLSRRFSTDGSVTDGLLLSPVSSDLISTALGGRLLTIDLSRPHPNLRRNLEGLCTHSETTPLVEAVTFISQSLRPLTTPAYDSEPGKHPLEKMFATLIGTGGGPDSQTTSQVLAVSIGVEVVLPDGIHQAAFPYSPSFIPRLQRGEMCLLFVPAMFRKDAFCAQLQKTLESSISEGWVSKTLGEMTCDDPSLVVTIPEVRYAVDISSSVIYPCNNPAVSPGGGFTNSKSALVRVGATLASARKDARRLMSRDLLQVGQPTPSAVLPGVSPGREYSCGMVSYVNQQAPNFCNTPGGAIQYCCEYPSTCSVASTVPRCSDDVVTPTSTSPALSGTVPGKEYDCASVPYVSGQSPNFCNTPSGGTQYCCAFPTTCSTTSSVPRCSNDPPSTPQSTSSTSPLPVVLPGNVPGQEYDCAEVPYIQGQSPNYCTTSTTFQTFCCPFPTNCVAPTSIPACA